MKLQIAKQAKKGLRHPFTWLASLALAAFIAPGPARAGEIGFEPDPNSTAIFPLVPSAATPESLVWNILESEDEASAAQAIAALRMIEKPWPWDQLKAQLQQQLTDRIGLLKKELAAEPDPKKQDFLKYLIQSSQRADLPRMAAHFSRLLDRLLNKPGMTWTWPQLEAWIRQGPPRPAGLPTGLTQRYLPCEHVSWNSDYFLYVPTAYDASKSYPLLIIMNGGNWDMGPGKTDYTALNYLSPWIALAEQRGWILASPAAAKGWGGMGYSLAFSTVNDVQRRYAVDPDRVYGWGQSMGGHACWRLAMFTPDRWAGLAPVCGGYDSYAESMVVTNNLALYQVWGETDPHSAGLNKTNRVLADALKKFGYDHRMVAKDGGHELFEDEFPNILAYFDKRPRDMYAKKVIATVGTLAITNADGAGQTEAFPWKKPMPFTQMHYWLECTEREDAKTPTKLVGEWTGPNTVTVTAEGVKRFSVYLHDRLIDFEKPVSVVINGHPALSLKAERSLDVLFQTVRRYHDRGRIYFGKLDFILENGKPVDAKK